MKLRIEVSDGLAEDEVVIRCRRMDDSVQKLQAYIQGLSAPKLTFYKGAREFYLPPEKILFFETDGETVYAHTADDAFKVKYRLYELESMLPRSFARAAKGTIINTARVYAITRNLAASSKIEFSNTHKHVYASRHYYKTLKDQMNERSVMK
ncbi:MAG: LytTR family transcriptional regulator [Oscillospiraceae bacterium]|nr:LytTR family transcriptional regulator [Oscillospiraceae bacterium]